MSIQGNKDFTLRIYKSDGTFIKTINVFSWSSIKFQTNGGCGQFVFQLPSRFDDYGEGSTVYYNNRVELWSVDKDTSPTGTLIYSGWIDTYSTKITGTDQSVEITCLGFVSFLTKALLTDGIGVGSTVVWETNGTDLAMGSAGTAAASSLSAIAQKAISLYRGYQSNTPISYNSASFDSGITAVTLTYAFDKVMVYDLLNTLIASAPAGSYWYVGADNVLQMRTKPASPVHTFVFGKHFAEVDVLNTADSVINNLVFETNNPDGSGTKSLSYYRDTVSEGVYGKLWDVESNSNYSVQADIDAVGNATVASEKNATRKITITLLDNSVAESYGLEGYPIEKIRPGDTCKFRGFNDLTSQDFPDNLQIVGIERTSTGVKLELEQLQDSIARQVATIIQDSQAESQSTGIATLGTAQPGGGNDKAHVLVAAAGNILVSGSATVIAWGSALFDTNNLFNAATPTRLTCKTSGYYRIRGQISANVASGTLLNAAIAVSGTGVSSYTMYANSSNYQTIHCEVMAYMQAGQYAEFSVYSSASGVYNNSYDEFFEMSLLN